MPDAWRASSAITRWNTVLLGTTSGRPLLVADELIITSPAACRSGRTALVSPEKAGPTMPITDWSPMNWSLMVDAWAGSPAVSNSFIVIWVPPLAFSSSMATRMPLRMLMPRLALSPVRAPTKPMVAVCVPLPWLWVVVLLLLLPQAASTSDDTATKAMTLQPPRISRDMSSAPSRAFETVKWGARLPRPRCSIEAHLGQHLLHGCEEAD